MTKRAYEDDCCNSGIADFFHWDESVEMLLASNPCPVLVARLLRLCRRVRNLVWRFLSGHADAEGVEWINQFLNAMGNWIDRVDLPQSLPQDVFLMDPIFVFPETPDTTLCVLGYIVFTSTASDDNYGIMTMITYTSDNRKPRKIRYMRNLYENTKGARYFDWYIVGLTLSIRFDKLVLASHIELQSMARGDVRWITEPSLFIAYDTCHTDIE